MAKLILESADPPREVAVGNTLRIGRDPDNEMALADPGSSRKHCRITFDGTSYVLEDLQSANGTYRNDVRVDRVKLEDGDVVRIGASRMRFVAGDDDEIHLDEPAAPAAAKFLLIGARGEVAGQRLPIRGERLTIGRKPSNSVVLTDAKASGVHCEVVIESGRAVLRDLGSTNGTFLEGKRIDEIVLSHGDRFVAGETEFVLADAAKPEPRVQGAGLDGTQTMIAMPDAVKVVRTTVRPRRGGALATIGVLVLLAGLGAAGWFYWKTSRTSHEVKLAPPPAGNLLGARWSFESAEDGAAAGTAWILADGGGAAFTISERGARSGEAAATARLDGKPARAALAEPLPVSDRRYAVSAFVKAEGEATAILAARFVSDADPGYRVAVPVASASGASAWTEIRGEVLVPPGAKAMQLLIAGAGNSGSVAFDDLAVSETGVARPERTSIAQFEFTPLGDALVLERGGATLLRVLGLAFECADGTRVESAEARVGANHGEVALSQGRTAQASCAFAANKQGATWEATFGGVAPDTLKSVGVALEILPVLANESVGVLKAGALEPYQESFETDGASGLLLGRGPTRLRVGCDPPVHVVAERRGESFALSLQPPLAAGHLKLAIQVDFVEERTQAAAILQQAKAARAAQQLGATLAALARITGEYPFDEDALASAEQLRTEVLRERDKLAQGVKDAAERAHFFKSGAAYVEAEGIAEAAAVALEGTPDAEAFRRQKQELANEREVLRKDAEARLAALLLQRADTALAQKPPRTLVAREIAGFVRERYPGTEAAAKAEQMASALEKAGN